ncbi:hypothetical protein IQ07DRAFT_581640 [Pyrenochaeta sp. DS3sAY3a]|nr:hypothetical protein IQ07DRAFT_581640 [Pyrenochaeta sp. DS3sAY3a]
MLSSYVCRQCKARLSRRIPSVRQPQWQPRATFLSFRSKKPQNEADSTPTEAQPQDDAQENPRAAQKSDRAHAPQPPPSRYWKLVPDNQYNASEAPASFSDGVTQTANEAASTPDARRSFARPILEALDKGGIERAWVLFEHSYTSKDCEALTDPSPEDLPLLNDGKIFERLLHAVNGTFCKGKSSLAITPTMALFRYEQLGVARREFWYRHTIAYLTHQIIETANVPTDKPQRDLPSLLSELLSIWQLFFQCKGPKDDPLEAISTEWNLPSLDSLPDMYESKNFGLRLQEYHPKHVRNSTLSFCAVYIFTISDALNSVEALQQQAAPLLQFLGHLLAGSSVKHVYHHMEMSRALQALPAEVQNQIKREIDAAPQKAMDMIGTTGRTLGVEETGNEYSNLEAFYLKRIARAIKSRTSTSELEGLWKQVQQAYRSNSANSEIPARVYNAFLSGFMVLLKAPRSVEVWNHMIAHNVQPTMESWVALLEGCVKARDGDGFNAMWTRMLSTGVEPDNYVWTTRVNGLFTLRQLSNGIAALDDMGKRWVAAENANISAQTRNSTGSKNLPKSAKTNKCTKPSVEVVNGAISALVRIPQEKLRQDKRIAFVQKILGWANSFLIKPDTRTYNSLINLYLRAGDQVTAFKVLAQMERAGVQGDIATYTMLVTAAFENGSFDNLSETAQTTRIISLLDDLENSGIKLNDHIYSAAIDRLLKNYSNFNAVRALIDHLTARQLVPSAHIYTSLITHYFQQTPPAILSVDSVVLQIFTSHRMPNDKILFDRLIEGYATHGEVAKMMSVLNKMARQGKLPGWPALTAVVRALVHEGNMERADGVVRDIARGEGIAHGGVTGNTAGQREFFRTVQELGIHLDEATEARLGDLWHGEHTASVNADQRVLGASRKVEQQVEDGLEDMEPGSVELEEDVHGFLTKETESQSTWDQKS